MCSRAVGAVGPGTLPSQTTAASQPASHALHEPIDTATRSTDETPIGGDILPIPHTTTRSIEETHLGGDILPYDHTITTPYDTPLIPTPHGHYCVALTQIFDLNCSFSLLIYIYFFLTISILLLTV